MAKKVAVPSNGNMVLEANIAALENQRASRDGRLEIAAAIAMLSTKVIVHVAPTPSVTPADLFDRTFDDPKVGLDDGKMRAFKDILALRLPQIADKIQSDIPEDAGLFIHLVAKHVHLTLLAFREANP